MADDLKANCKKKKKKFSLRMKTMEFCVPVCLKCGWRCLKPCYRPQTNLCLGGNLCPGGLCLGVFVRGGGSLSEGSLSLRSLCPGGLCLGMGHGPGGGVCQGGGLC